METSYSIQLSQEGCVVSNAAGSGSKCKTDHSALSDEYKEPMREPEPMPLLPPSSENGASHSAVSDQKTARLFSFPAGFVHFHVSTRSSYSSANSPFSGTRFCGCRTQY